MFQRWCQLPGPLRVRFRAKKKRIKKYKFLHNYRKKRRLECNDFNDFLSCFFVAHHLILAKSPSHTQGEMTRKLSEDDAVTHKKQYKIQHKYSFSTILKYARTGHVSPQFHVVYDDDFTTVPHWAQLVNQSAESTISDNSSTTWESLGPFSHHSDEEDFTTYKAGWQIPDAVH